MMVANISEIKTTSGIKLVFNSSTITMMHGPLNILYTPLINVYPDIAVFFLVVMIVFSLP